MKTSLEDIMEIASLRNPSSFGVRIVWTKNDRIEGEMTSLLKTYDDFVSFLFDKVELFGWKISNYHFDPRAYVTGITDDLSSFIYGGRFTVTITKED